MLVIKKACLAGIISILPLALANAADAPSIGGAAKIDTDIKGAIINAGGASTGATVTAKQAITSVLSGSIGGSLSDELDVKGAIINAGAGAAKGTITTCQAVGTIGDNCDE